MSLDFFNNSVGKELKTPSETFLHKRVSLILILENLNNKPSEIFPQGPLKHPATKPTGIFHHKAFFFQVHSDEMKGNTSNNSPQVIVSLQFLLNGLTKTLPISFPTNHLLFIVLVCKSQRKYCFLAFLVATSKEGIAFQWSWM